VRASNPTKRSGSELLGYTGYARRFESGYSVDAGASYATFSSQHTTTREVHAAVASNDLTAQSPTHRTTFAAAPTRCTPTERYLSRVGRIARLRMSVLRLSPSELFYGPPRRSMRGRRWIQS